MFVFFVGLGNRATIHIRFLLKEGLTHSRCASTKLLGGSLDPSRMKKRENQHKGTSMKKLLLLPLVAIGLALVPVKQTDAQVSVGVGGVGIGFGYPAYRYSYYSYPGYYPYGYYGGYPYYRTYYYGGRPYYYSGNRVYRHHKHHHNY